MNNIVKLANRLIKKYSSKPLWQKKDVYYVPFILGDIVTVKKNINIISFTDKIYHLKSGNKYKVVGLGPIYKKEKNIMPGDEDLIHKLEEEHPFKRMSDVVTIEPLEPTAQERKNLEEGKMFGNNNLPKLKYYYLDKI